MEISLKGHHTEGSFSVVQFRAAECDTLDYISAGTAVKEEKLEITESSEGGTVSNILVVNKSDKCVFISEGDLLKGAKQNRVLITSVFLTPDAKFNLPVNCVEQGRWSRRSKNFTPHPQSAPMNIKRNIRYAVDDSLRERRLHAANQGRTWSSVSQLSTTHARYSSTDDLIEIMKEKTDQYESSTKHFVPDIDANGLVVFYGGDPVTVEVYNRRDIYAEYFRKVVLSAYDDYEFYFKNKPEPKKGELEFKSIELLESFDRFEKSKHKGVAAGEEKRFRDDVTSGIELLYNEKSVHLSVLREVKAAE